MSIVFSYAALFGVMYVLLSLRVVGLRQKVRVSIGDGNDDSLRRAIRVHGNFSEYVPFCILLIYFVELQTGIIIYVHILSVLLLISRISHAYGVSHVKEVLRYRVFGMLTNAIVILACSSLILVYSVN